MLVLNRTAEQTIRIGDANVHILGIRKGRVRLGIDAPASTQIVRGEIDPERKEPPRNDRTS